MEKLNPDSMQCIKCGFVVFGGVELDEQVCLCGKGKGAWVCNYSKVSVPRYEFEELQRKFEGLKKESSVIKNNKCPSCLRGDEPDIIDEDGTLVRVSGHAGMPGHGYGDSYVHCCHYELGDKPCPICGEAPEMCKTCGFPDHCHIPGEGVFVGEEEVEDVGDHEFVPFGKRTWESA